MRCATSLHRKPSFTRSTLRPIVAETIMKDPMKIVAISGSPSAKSRSGWLLQLAQTRLESIADVVSIAVRDLPAAPLLHANASEPQIRAALDLASERWCDRPRPLKPARDGKLPSRALPTPYRPSSSYTSSRV